MALPRPSLLTDLVHCGFPPTESLYAIQFLEGVGLQSGAFRLRTLLQQLHPAREVSAVVPGRVLRPLADEDLQGLLMSRRVIVYEPGVSEKEYQTLVAENAELRHTLASLSRDAARRDDRSLELLTRAGRIHQHAMRTKMQYIRALQWENRALQEKIADMSAAIT